MLNDKNERILYCYTGTCYNKNLPNLTGDNFLWIKIQSRALISTLAVFSQELNTANKATIVFSSVDAHYTDYKNSNIK
jgi:hypothetical protein